MTEIAELSRELFEVRRAVNILHVYIKIRDIEVYEHVSNI